MIRRREFITLLGGAVAWPLVARAQQPAVPVVGFLSSASLEGFSPYLATFRQGLSETGFIEGRNVAVEYRWGAPLSALDLPAADLVNRRVTVIAANTAGAALRAKAATASIPIVFVAFADAVKVGLVTNLGRTVMSPESI